MARIRYSFPALTWKEILLITIAITAASMIYLLPPIPQNQAYHDFADTRAFFNIPNFLDVLSNFFFLLFGTWGMKVSGSLLRRRPANTLCRQYFVLFAGVFLTGIGSSVYHLDPNNYTLFWDRLPMTIAFAALFSTVASEMISEKAGELLFIPCLLLGFSSVFYWIISEALGIGDLRLYAIVQFLPMLLIPLILLLYQPPPDYLKNIIGLLFFYLCSKIFEFYDHNIFVFTDTVASGHTLKHIFAGSGIFFLARLLMRREAPSK